MLRIPTGAQHAIRQGAAQVAQPAMNKLASAQMKPLNAPSQSHGPKVNPFASQQRFFSASASLLKEIGTADSGIGGGMTTQKLANSMTHYAQNVGLPLGEKMKKKKPNSQPRCSCDQC
ncbi:MAG: hypothetical protein GJ677_15480 [Rhodobacteraceae bacterium]|nr:hypothetical protein [Paracoccaceae bacterium]